METKNHIEKAIEVLNQGGIIIYPTDTAFGIGCRIDNEEAVKSMFAIRKRSENKATPVLVDTVDMAQKYVEPISKDVIDTLIEPYWPGALTIILQCKTNVVSKRVRGWGNTLGVRIPNHKIARAIIRGVGAGILGPSANIAGGKTPYMLADLDEGLVKQIDYVVPGECTIKQSSTVIDCTVNPWKVLRQGAIALEVSSHKLEVRLHIDTSNNKEIKVGLETDGKIDWQIKEITYQKAQVVLPMIDEMLKSHHLTLQDVSEIKVNKGPGSFTGLRVGIAVANALAWNLAIPINGKKQIVEPQYQ